MKNEEKLLELLAEYLLKTDRSLDRIEALQKQIGELQGQTSEFQKQTIEFQKQTAELQKQTGELQKQTGEFHKINLETQKEIKELRRESLKHEIKNDVLLKEILSISKRVLTLEEKTNLFG